MTLLLVNENMYNFETVDDAFLWIQLHKKPEDEILILGDSDSEEAHVEAYLDQIAPIEIIEV